MKSAFLVGKSPLVFSSFSSYLKSLGYPCTEAPGSIRVHPESEPPFTVYDRPSEGSFFERYEIPEDAVSAGYVYGFMAECRSESLFCKVVGSVPTTLDIVIVDGDGALYWPKQLDPLRIVL